MSAHNPLDDPVFGKYKFYTANPKTKLNRKLLIRANSIYDDGTDPEQQRKKSRFSESLAKLLENITLHCYNRILENNRTTLEK